MRKRRENERIEKKKEETTQLNKIYSSITRFSTGTFLFESRPDQSSVAVDALPRNSTVLDFCKLAYKFKEDISELGFWVKRNNVTHREARHPLEARQGSCG